MQASTNHKLVMSYAEVVEALKAHYPNVLAVQALPATLMEAQTKSAEGISTFTASGGALIFAYRVGG